MDEIEDIKAGLRGENAPELPTFTQMLGTGCTTLNCAISGRPNGGYLAGTIVLYIGDSSSGKTWMALQALAQAMRSKYFSKYDLIYDNAENGALMSIEEYFGAAVAEKLQPPRGTRERPVYSSTVEEFYFNAQERVKKRPCIYILDSMDALSSMAEGDKFKKTKAAVRAGKETAGIMTDGKAKANSQGLRVLNNAVMENGSIVFIICQSREKIGAMFDSKTYAGGKGLKFYSCLEIWTSVVEKLKKQVRGKLRQVGVRSKVQLKKNRITGKEWSVEIAILRGYGADDVGACIDFLVDEKHWKKGKKGSDADDDDDTKGAVIKAHDFEVEGSRDYLIKYIEDNNLEKPLRQTVGEVWAEIEAACLPTRKKRY
jgi:recombination protein RecA